MGISASCWQMGTEPNLKLRVNIIYIYNRLLLAITPVVSVVCKLMRSIVEAISSPAVTSVNVAKFRLRLDDNVLRKSGKVFPHPYSSVVKMIHVHINPEK